MTTPFDSNAHLFFVKSEEEIIYQNEYTSMIGSLRYTTDCIRPNIAYAMGILSRFTNKSGIDHWHAMKRVMKYLIGTKNYGLFYKKVFYCTCKLQ